MDEHRARIVVMLPAAGSTGKGIREHDQHARLPFYTRNRTMM
jgi:hypothetical protein